MIEWECDLGIRIYRKKSSARKQPAVTHFRVTAQTPAERRIVAERRRAPTPARSPPACRRVNATTWDISVRYIQESWKYGH